MNLQEKSRKLKMEVPAVFLALIDGETPLAAKILAAITVGYVLSPIDLIPDFIPVLGYLDDVILVPALIMMTVKLIPTSIWERCLIEADDLWKDGKPRKWYYAIPIVAIWLLLIWIVVGIILGK